MAAPEEFTVDRVLPGRSGTATTAGWSRTSCCSRGTPRPGRAGSSSRRTRCRRGAAVKGWKNKGGKFGFATKGKGCGRGVGRTGAGGSRRITESAAGPPARDAAAHPHVVPVVGAGVRGEMLALGVVPQPQERRRVLAAGGEHAARLRTTYRRRAGEGDGKPAQTQMGTAAIRSRRSRSPSPNPRRRAPGRRRHAVLMRLLDLFCGAGGQRWATTAPGSTSSASTSSRSRTTRSSSSRPTRSTYVELPLATASTRSTPRRRARRTASYDARTPTPSTPT